MRNEDVTSVAMALAGTLAGALARGAGWTYPG